MLAEMTYQLSKGITDDDEDGCDREGQIQGAEQQNQVKPPNCATSLDTVTIPRGRVMEYIQSTARVRNT
jgi:hypothetical protein